MADAQALGAVTDLAGKQADLLFALINVYGLVVIAVVGWIVQTGKDSNGISWFRIILFNLGLLFFFAATFAGAWYLLERLRATVAVWENLAGAAGLSPGEVAAVAQMPPQEWLWGLWVFNGIMLILTTVLLRNGGFGRDDAKTR